MTSTDHMVGVNLGMGAVGGADDAASAVGPGSEAGGRAGAGVSGAGVGGAGVGGAGVGSAGEAAYADQEYESAA
ncbi:MAG TPA: hypothetical protein VJ418_23830 [Streptosporangiaceae bacterium]|nr:hypothetical protein [Streptosporangiaceae bacterium]